MDVMIITLKACAHRKNLEKELEHLQIPYCTCVVENCAYLVQKFGIQHLPNLVDNEVVFRKQPREVELHAYFEAKT